MSGRQWWDYRGRRNDELQADRAAAEKQREDYRRIVRECKADPLAIEREVNKWNTPLTVPDAIRALTLHVVRLQRRVEDLESGRGE
jgi:hypothetical protein